ncbi:MAG TPA: carbohydrate ABC transporter permease [Chthoniobacterales bacterium]|nr:carbohydrate ABC transporter permease [Chthoniobacterales bacterium]
MADAGEGQVKAASVKFFGPGMPRSLADWGILGVLCLFLLVFLMPLYLMVITGLKDATNVSLSSMWNLPAYLSGGGFSEAWKRLWPSMVNSLFMTTPATIISAILGAVNGYVFSKCKFKGSNLLFIAFAFGMFIPYQSIIIPLVKFLQTINLYGTVLGLIAVHVVYGIPITAMLFRNFFDTLPNELIEAAKIDGATLIDVLLRIMLPLARPAFIVAGIYQFTNIWNDFLFGVTIVPNPKAQPITVALNNLSGSFSVDWNVVMAGAVIAAIPTALIYIFLGKFFVRGMLAGSVKG